MKKFEKTIRF